MFENINPLRLQTMQTILESQDAEDWDTFISCWEGDDFVQIVGDPESQDVIPFFGVHRGFKEYKQCIDDYADGMFKIQEYIANEVFEMGDVTFGIGDATYIFEPTVKSSTRNTCFTPAGVTRARSSKVGVGWNRLFTTKRIRNGLSRKVKPSFSCSCEGCVRSVSNGVLDRTPIIARP